MTGLSAIRIPISPISNKVHGDLVPRCRDTCSSQMLNESSITLRLYQADDDDIEFLTGTLVDGVDEAIEPSSSCGFLAKIPRLCSVGGEHAYVSKLLTMPFERLDECADCLDFLQVPRACSSFRNKLLSVSNIDEVVQGCDIVLQTIDGKSQRQNALQMMIGGPKRFRFQTGEF